MTLPSWLLPDASPRSLDGSLRDYRDPDGPHLLERTEPFLRWQDHRRQRLLWPYGRSIDAAPRAECDARYDSGVAIHGINLASRDPLGLSSHRAIKRAAQRAIRDYGVHGAGAAAFMGNSAYSLALERRLGEFLRMEHCVLFPSGWTAGYGVVRALLGERDHVVLDERSGACVKEGARAATRRVRLVQHLDTDAFRAALAHIRGQDANGAILVATRSFFPLDGDTPDLATLQAICREYAATLLVDVTHDLGSMGDDGTGVLGLQGMLGGVDLVVGSFSCCFAANGGFVLSRRRSIKEYLRYFAPSQASSSALEPAQAAVAMQALDIARSREGHHLRHVLFARVRQLREGLAMRGFRCLGSPAPVVAVPVGEDAFARLLARRLPLHDVIADLVEYPGSILNDARLRLQVMATHTLQHMERAAAAIASASLGASLDLDRIRRNGQGGWEPWLPPPL